jgi:2-keto-4-pentenoate hydratase/2-oxohepta-3-ene-1,7-dioic acid hydratase in catechol pathway
LRLVTIRRGGREEAAVVLPDGVAPVREAGVLSRESADLLSLLESGRFYELKEAYDRGEVRGGASSQRSFTPLYRRPRKIWGVGLNYVEHAGDLSESAPADEPASFMRPDTNIIGPGEEIVLPDQSERVPAEAELTLVIGREAKNVPEEDAPSVVAGFTTVLDTTAEDILRRNPRYLTRAKSFDTFFSFGPELVTPDEVADVGGSGGLDGPQRRGQAY